MVAPDRSTGFSERDDGGGCLRGENLITAESGENDSLRVDSGEQSKFHLQKENY